MFRWLSRLSVEERNDELAQWLKDIAIKDDVACLKLLYSMIHPFPDLYIGYHDGNILFDLDLKVPEATDDMTPLMHACLHDNFEVVSELIVRGASPVAIDSTDGSHVIHVALRNKDSYSLGLILLVKPEEAFARVEKCGDISFHVAIQYSGGCIENLMKLLQAGDRLALDNMRHYPDYDILNQFSDGSKMDYVAQAEFYDFQAMAYALKGLPRLSESTMPTVETKPAFRAGLLKARFKHAQGFLPRALDAFIEPNDDECSEDGRYSTALSISSTGVCPASPSAELVEGNYRFL